MKLKDEIIYALELEYQEAKVKPATFAEFVANWVIDFAWEYAGDRFSDVCYDVVEKHGAKVLAKFPDTDYEL